MADESGRDGVRMDSIEDKSRGDDVPRDSIQDKSEGDDVATDPSQYKSDGDDIAMDSSQDKLYMDAQKYWATVSPTIDGMLGGFGNISPTDINGSKAFLRPFLKSSGGSVASMYALDCGAGIGRITKRLLLPIFDKVDMVEQDKHFCDTAREFIGSESGRVINIFCSGLQNFKPSKKTYDVIWCQWVLGHLKDEDLIGFFSRCKQALSPGGIIVVKENTVAVGTKAFDEADSSYTRTKDELKILMLKADLKVLSVQKQKDFPKSLYPVYMFALR